MYGYFGKMLRIELETQKTMDLNLDSKILKSYLGGRGLGIKFLFDRFSKKDAFSPENPLIFTTGPCTGIAPFSAFYCVTTKSALTKTALSSHSGGYWGAALKKTGYDGVIVEGKSETPVYVKIGEEVSFEDAENLWGKNVFETTETLKNEGSVLCIGRAGENLVRFASIMNDKYRACGRGGAGAVMGSKNLKAIVVKGRKKPEIFDKEKLRRIFKKSRKISKKKAANFSKYGTPLVVNITNEANVLPTKNFRKNHFEYGEKISADSLINYKIKDKACFACPIACSNYNKFKAYEGEGPEYETLYSLGSCCMNKNLEDIIKANYLCNDYGMDTISCGVTLAYAMESGLISWGEVSKYIPMVGERSGIGEEISQGVMRMSEKYGKNHAVHVKGLEPPGYDARGLKGMALAYATSNRGACHLRATMYVLELFKKELDRKTFREKPQVLKNMQDFFSILDSLTICKFGARNVFSNSWEEISELLYVVTGIDFDLKKIGERIYNLERLYNVMQGFGRDRLPERFFQEVNGDRIERQKFEKALSEYYELRGWDENGVPKAEKLKELGIF